MSYLFFIVCFCYLEAGLEGGIFLLIAPVPVHCFLITFSRLIISVGKAKAVFSAIDYSYIC